MCYLCIQNAGATLSVTAAAGNKVSLSLTDGAQKLLSYNASWAASSTATTEITYGFRNSAPSYNADASGIQTSFQKVSPHQMSAIREALNTWADIANIRFVEINPGAYTDNATILFANYSSTTDGFAGFAYLPDSRNMTPSSSEGDVWLNNNNNYFLNLNLDSYPYLVVVHEIGHALGLYHPGNYNGAGKTYAADAEFFEDTRQYSIMSYFSASNTGADHSESYARTPLLLDVIAIQQLYGSNQRSSSGNDVYGFNSTRGSGYSLTSASSRPVFTIWDSGGVDTLDLSGFSQTQEISLIDGTFSNAGGLTKNISIALGVQIENAIGGTGNDTIIGNAENNWLEGGRGNDILRGQNGNDVLVFQSQPDLDGDLLIDGGAGIDTILLNTGAMDLELIDTDFDKARNLEAIVLNGIGHQAVNLGANVTAAFASGITINSQPTAKSLYLLGALSSIAINVTGTNNADLLEGGSSNDVIDGGSGADTILLGDGQNIANGGDGDDLISGGSGLDQFFGGAGADTIYADKGLNFVNGEAGEDTLIMPFAYGYFYKSTRSVSSSDDFRAGYITASYQTEAQGIIHPDQLDMTYFSNIEFFLFAGNVRKTFNEMIAGSTFEKVAPTSSQYLHAIYSVMYGRTADANGHRYWSSQFNLSPNVTVSVDLAQRIADGFENASPNYFNSQYGSLSNADFVRKLYVNLGGNTDGVDNSAINYWQGRLGELQGDRGKLTGEFTLAFLGYTGWDSGGLQRVEQLASRVALSQAWVSGSEQKAFMNARAVNDPAFQAQSQILMNIDGTGSQLQSALDKIAAVVQTGAFTPILGVRQNALSTDLGWDA